MKKNAVIIGLMLVFAGASAAQTDANSDTNVDTVILASTSNYPDAMMSASVSNKLGYPVLLTKQNTLSASTETSLEEMDPNNVIIVGGPSVVSEQVETEASRHGNVTRLWGTTQVGTSAEVADYFWAEGSEEAVIVQYPLNDESYHSMMGAVKNEAGERPILVSKEGTLSASVLTAVGELGVEEAEVYSTDALNVTDDLKSSGVNDVEINLGEREELVERLKNRTSTEGREELVIVAAGNFRDTISVPNNPNSASYIVSSESEIDGAVAVVGESDEETRIKVVGRPQLASTISTRIENETGRNVSQLSGAPDEISSGQAREQRAEWQNIQQQRSSNWKQSLSLTMRDRANSSIQRAERAVDENSSEEAQRHLQMAKEAFDNANYFEARRMAVAARSSVKVEAFAGLEPEEVKEKVQEDREDLREATRELSETNQEMAQELREAETQQERLEIIREHREERMDILEEVRRNRGPMNRGEEDDEEREEENETEAPNQMSSKLRIELDGNELSIDASYTGRTGGYTVDKSMDVENGQIDAEFNFQSPGGPATQVLTEYESDLERTLEDGDYSVSIELMADEKLRESISDSITVPGEVELESETDGIEVSGNTQELEEEENDSYSGY